MMDAHSSSSTATPSTIANTACYDPLSKCIRLPSVSSDGGAILEGHIIEMDIMPPSSQPGKLLLGEIVEIVIMDAENMTPLAVYNEKTASTQQQDWAASPTAAMSTNHSLTREELLQKQREQQQLHYQQSQDLLQRNQQEKQQLDALQREGRLSSESRVHLYAEMERTHQGELMELQQDHQREQTDMTDLIFESASVASKGSGDTNEAGKQPKNVTGLWNRAAVATVAAGTIQHQIAADEIDQSQPTNETPDNTTTGLWNRAAVATVAAGTINQRTKSDNSPAPSTPLVDNTTSKKNGEEQEKEELKAVMRDRHIPKEERIRRISEIRQSYSDSESAAPAMPQLSTQIESSKSNDELRREEVQSVMKDQTLDRQEKQKLLSGIKAKYAKAPSDQPDRKNVRWNRAAVTAVAANTMSQSREQTQGQQQQDATTSGNRWNRAAVTAVTANTLNQSFTKMKQIQGNSKPMSVFIQQLKSNDPSLITLILDGRKSVSSDEWTDLFDALEGNAHLTHLSLVNCGLTDETTVPLVLALVENETLISLDLSKNRDLTNGTGKSLHKVLKQSNPVLKKVNMDGTAISSKTSAKIMDVLADRDDTLKLAKVQAARQKKD